MKKTIALFTYDPKCSIQSCNGIMQALGTKYNFKLFSKNELEYSFFDNVDIVCVPGGIGDADSFDNLFKNNSGRVKQFIKNGGRYLGICMGAYWAGRHYLNLLDNLHAVQYMNRPGSNTHRPHAKNMPITWQGESETMFWYDGCTFVGHGNYKTIATYANGDPMAIIQGNLGLIGCHPESEAFWYDSYSWMRGRYHNGLHHQLLVDFIDQLVL